MNRMHALLHERLEVRTQPGLVVDLTEFQGYEGIAAMRDDLRMDLSHRNDFGRIAVIGDRKWMEWGTAFAGMFNRRDYHQDRHVDADGGFLAHTLCHNRHPQGAGADHEP